MGFDVQLQKWFGIGVVQVEMLGGEFDVDFIGVIQFGCLVCIVGQYVGGCGFGVVDVEVDFVVVGEGLYVIGDQVVK